MLANYGTDLSTGCAPGDTDEERLSDIVGVLIPVPKMCLTITGHTCTVATALLRWKIFVPKPLPQNVCCVLTLPYFKFFIHTNVFKMSFLCTDAI